MSGSADRPADDAPPPVEVTNQAPNYGAQGIFNELVTFDQRGTHAPALTAAITYGIQGPVTGPVTFDQRVTPVVPAQTPSYDL